MFKKNRISTRKLINSMSQELDFVARKVFDLGFVGQNSPSPIHTLEMAR